jgi:hypothetical protein
MDCCTLLCQVICHFTNHNLTLGCDSPNFCVFQKAFNCLIDDGISVTLLLVGASFYASNHIATVESLNITVFEWPDSTKKLHFNVHCVYLTIKVSNMLSKCHTEAKQLAMNSCSHISILIFERTFCMYVNSFLYRI